MRWSWIVSVIVFCALPAAAKAADPIVNASTEQKLLIDTLPDGGLPPVIGVQSFQIFRASHSNPDTSWTYNHHMDMGLWHGRIYVAWTNGQKDEDIWPSHELYSSSPDGLDWSKPAELFPQGVSTSLRIYFFHAPSGRMLAVAGLRIGTQKLVDATYGGIVVREILADQTLGPVYTLRNGPSKAMIPQPWFETSSDAGFVRACHELLANHTFLEQQDNGVLLGADRMAAYQGASSDFGKAFCFFRRADGTLVGIAKKAWTITSTDEGKTWSAPVRPASIITDSAKEWVQRTSDGKFAFVFNPHATNRFPLVCMTSSDGITFDHMRTVCGEVPVERYASEHKNIGPQYVRGISEWATDGSTIPGAGAKDMWIVYSSNKEDVWIARIPVPIRYEETKPVHDRFDSLADWNIYRPAWCGASVIKDSDGSHAMQLTNRDPYDYVKAERVFPETANPTVHFRVKVAQRSGTGRLEIDLRPAFGDARPVQLILMDDGRIAGPGFGLGTFSGRDWIDVKLSADAANRRLSIFINGFTAHAEMGFAEPATSFQRLVFRTGWYRDIEKTPLADPKDDKLIDASSFIIKDVDIE